MVACASWSVVAGPSAASAGPVPRVDLLDKHLSVLDGAADVVGSADVNGDGLGDLVLWGGRPARVSIVFAPLPEWVDLDHLSPEDGYNIYSDNWEYFYDAIAAVVGDVNGDGLAEIAVGDYRCINRACRAGTFVVFGKSDRRAVRVNDIGLNLLNELGFRITGGEFDDIAAAGDVNADGYDDILLGGSGNAYVVFGKSGYLPVSVDGLQSARDDGGYWISLWWNTHEVTALANAGDVNRDGLSDAVIGVVRSPRTRGRAYVVHGKKDSTDIDITTHDLGRFRIRGLYRGSYTGSVVDGGSDVNGDAAPDVLVTASGAAFVVFGKSDVRAVRLTNPRHHALRIRGLDDYTYLGVDGDLLGDVNGDGLGDVAVRAHSSAPGDGAGRVDVVYGHRTRLVAQLGDPSSGVRITAPCDPGEPCGVNYLGDFAGIADVDGDGLRDIAVVAHFLARRRSADQGKVFVVGSSAWTD